MSPLTPADGHDAPRLIGEVVPGVAAQGDDWHNSPGLFGDNEGYQGDREEPCYGLLATPRAASHQVEWYYSALVDYFTPPLTFHAFATISQTLARLGKPCLSFLRHKLALSGDRFIPTCGDKDP